MKKAMLLAALLLSDPFSSRLLASAKAVKPEHVFLTPTYGILGWKEFEFARHTYDEDLLPPGFRYNDMRVWRCGLAKNVRINCDGGGDELDGSLIYIQLRDGKMTHEYIYRRGFGKSFCRDQLFRLRQVIKNARHICLAGSFISEEKGRAYYIFDQIKSESDGFCYFEGCR